MYRPPYGLTGWGRRQIGHEVVLRTLTLHLPTNMPPPLHPEVINIDFLQLAKPAKRKVRLPRFVFLRKSCKSNFGICPRS